MSLSHDINPDAVRRYVALIEICNKLIRRYIEPCEEGVWLSFFFLGKNPVEQWKAEKLKWKFLDDVMYVSGS